MNFKLNPRDRPFEFSDACGQNHYSIVNIIILFFFLIILELAKTLKVSAGASV